MSGPSLPIRWRCADHWKAYVPARLSTRWKNLFNPTRRCTWVSRDYRGNEELTRILESIQERIRFVRWIDMENRRQTTFGEHLAIIDAIHERDTDRALALIGTHVERRAEQITAVVP